jgi:hypothetical protein
MPKRTDTHVIADIAVNDVQKIVAECGWASESVYNDYGEDLLVQTSHKQEMDSFKMWIQVKGTRNLKRFRSKRWGYSLKLSKDHIAKWLRTIDPVIIVLWDVNTKSGLWCLPHKAFEKGLLHKTKEGKIRIVFPVKQVFDIRGLHEIVWDARIEHYNTLAASKMVELEHWESQKDFKLHRKWIKLNWTELFDTGRKFLSIVDAFESNGIRDIIVSAAVKLHRESVPRPKIIPLALLLAILKKVQDVTGKGLPYPLLFACMNSILCLPQKKEKTRRSTKCRLTKRSTRILGMRR